MKPFYIRKEAALWTTAASSRYTGTGIRTRSRSPTENTGRIVLQLPIEFCTATRIQRNVSTKPGSERGTRSRRNDPSGSRSFWPKSRATLHSTLGAHVPLKSAAAVTSIWFLDELAECLASESDPASEYEAKELGQFIRQFVNHLPERDRNIFLRLFLRRNSRRNSCTVWFIGKSRPGDSEPNPKKAEISPAKGGLHG